MRAPARYELDPPNFVRLAADPLRWRLLQELAHSDRRVRELCAILDRSQSLVSHHLAKLHAGELVYRRRSSADGRDFYYALDLRRCAALLAESGAALHPGLRPSAPPDPASRTIPSRVLFLCTGNSARSQIAEGLAQGLGGGAVVARSAGSDPKPVHPLAVRVMHERGIEIASRRSKHLDEFASERFDAVVTLCDRVREVCPEFPGNPEPIHWCVPDPSREGGSARAAHRAFQRTAEELAVRIPFLLGQIAPEPSTVEVS